ncbi:hypothetical protein CYY_002858 [Polysphondylium violaceum]|uniref:Calcineurin-like phosphoesterase domain-containing protein n=1 Tax=Polysphondylium violaceum TaxID=133409 RepID=A0A8J4V982_9MYCE|nr:hypothetical protein CYY_002858 [Polysphondylium violaceum]
MFFCNWKYNINKENDIAQMILLGDPQMEGDWRIKREGLKGEYNIAFNDRFFKHIVDNIAYYLQPSLVFVLGDLFSSQYINDDEFLVRTNRYRNIFSPLLYKQSKSELKIINVTGNHDIGYANEASLHRINRFEQAFGKVNDKFYVSGHLFGVVNSINLDRSQDERLYNQTWDHLRALKEEAESTQSPLIILTHIPLYKDIDTIDRSLPLYQQQPFLCRERDHTRKDRNGNIIEQTMISKESSDYILEHLKPLFIFNGHDHEGCIFKHQNNITTEYTIRSMMGGYAGYSALFELKKLSKSSSPSTKEEFEYSFQWCPFIETRFINISFGVTGGWLVLFILFNLVLSFVVPFINKHKQDKKKKIQ